MDILNNILTFIYDVLLFIATLIPGVLFSVILYVVIQMHWSEHPFFLNHKAYDFNKMSNPNIRGSGLPLGIILGTTVKISFNKNKRLPRKKASSAVRDAVFEIIHKHPETNVLVFDNLPAYGIEQTDLYPFTLDILDFSNIHISDENRASYYYLKNISSYTLRCRTLILPYGLTYIHLFECEKLKQLCIPSQTVVKAYSVDGSPVIVDSSFCIKVSENLISSYVEDPTWKALSFIDINKKPVHPVFIPYDYEIRGS